VSDWYCEELLSGRAAVDVLFEDDAVVAFWHTRPHYAHHAVVVPKHHVESLLTCDPATLAGLMEVVRAIAAGFVAGYGGAHVVTNLGDYQESKHLHFHVGAD